MAEILEYKCPCCGGAIEFDSSIQKMKCPYCDTEFEMETLKALDEELKADIEDDMNWNAPSGDTWQEGEEENIKKYNCESCGGQIIGDMTAAAASCPFCGNPVVFAGQLAGELKPDYVIPFKLDKKAAKEAFKNHLKGKILLPKVFKDENHIDEIKAVYVPFWLFNADAKARLRYRCTKVRSWSDSRYIYTETSHFSVVRGGQISFDGVPVDGSSKMDDALMESIEPFDFGEAKEFQSAYLAGYLADRYDVSEEDSVTRANARIKQSTEDSFRNTVRGYSSVMPETNNIQFNNSKANYALYPVWILNTTWNGKQYRFAMNGQTGKFVGDLPMDKKAFWKWFLGIMAGSAAVIYLFMWLSAIF